MKTLIFLLLTSICFSGTIVVSYNKQISAYQLGKKEVRMGEVLCSVVPYKGIKKYEITCSHVFSDYIFLTTADCSKKNGIAFLNVYDKKIGIFNKISVDCDRNL